MIRASKLLGAKVFDNGNKKLGLVVNVIFGTDPDHSVANLLVFPDNTKGLLDRLSETLRDSAVDLVTEYFPADLPKVKAFAEMGSAKGVEMWNKYVEEKKRELLQTYYVVPLIETENPGQGIIKKIKINHNKEDCDQFRCKPDDYDFPFFRNRSFTGIGPLLKTTLTLQHVERLKNSLPDGKKGQTVDLELDYAGGLVENLIVQTYGRGAAKHRVNPKDFDFSELNAKKMARIQDASGDA